VVCPWWGALQKERVQAVESTSGDRGGLPGENRVWIISEGRPPAVLPEGILESPEPGSLKEYRVSDIARYLLDPGPVEIRKLLLGCEIHYRQPLGTRFKSRLRGLFSFGSGSRAGAVRIPPDVLVSRFHPKVPPLSDPDLQAHVNAIYESLRAYDPMARKLPRLDQRRIAHVIGICRDVGGQLSYLKLQGGTTEKLKYMAANFARNVPVSLKRAYIAEGLFELRGFDFSTYESRRTWRLLTYRREGRRRALVLATDNWPAYVLEDDQLMKYVFLLEHAMRSNRDFRALFDLFIHRQAIPVKLFFNRELEIDYSRSHFPSVYRDIFRACRVGWSQRNLVRPSLNYLTVAVSLSYLPLAGPGQGQLYTHICILHDLRALESVKNNLPQVYSEIRKRSFRSEAGSYYVLDSIEGAGNA